MSKSHPRSLHGRTILLVEDEFLILLDLQFILEGVGAEVVTATSVAEGLEAAEGAFDVAVLDVRLPDGEVYPVAEKLAERRVPLVFHSGHAQGEHIRTDFPSAVALAKPARERVLIAAVESQAGTGRAGAMAAGAGGRVA